ncbi:Nif3-like dinuclear metal center hexameric protein [Niveibacterium sp. 24ML]|uniref:Nif3-like dinuclear metal center hexameric protein n=1 Tax=Niveibacterium sp. 24ML TaxID=2985512 RepID=UPI00226F4515|nr:Nif3-like dinuclear metal center hexameric protein [Niveibacterium sp. 24ML]MCX9154871.1 Nif3-like dinuclear metal center hexameric protein [Niveibacterium sp. 24ML]
MHRDELTRYLDDLLGAPRIKDYCPNGLQVEGRADVRKLVCGVTASLALIDAAIARGADGLLVHHGYFWRGEDPRVLATRRKRLARLLGHDLNLYAYHLPLDLHPELGNNAQLAKLMGWRAVGRFGDQDIGVIGELEAPAPLMQVARSIGARLGREPLVVGEAAGEIRHVAWCTGAAQGMFEAAIAAGAELFVSGEVSEPTVHLARESGVPYIAAGHHATERYGVHALGAHLQAQLGIHCEFVDIDNPA